MGENQLQYIYLVLHYHLSKQIKAQSEAFFEGLSKMIDQRWIRMFNQQEVQILLGGMNAPIDFDDLRRNNYGGLYHDNEATIIAFCKVVNSFNQEQCMALLRFITSCSRPLLLYVFIQLVPNFSICDLGQDQLQLPTASTCVNL
ncbi:hypothetical protein L208DRAFT_1475648 [Tricholoma matsutake]|nr:hypothetical protein L208DRAFT_1475648 [Tricholoma matsutake 945]